MIYYLITLIILGLDQLTKYIVAATMDIGQSLPVIRDFLYWTSSRNTGAAWNILEGQMWFFYIITIIVAFVVIYYIHTVGRYHPLLGVALALILGGTLGNFIDRIFRGAVVDFIDVYLGSYSYPIFNLADSSLVVGAILLLVYTYLDAKKEKRQHESN
ncbi:signal peptidase II [Tuberibacillus sp. Marseille-P3662]|uniref:signal peptidase II n=1 Tax=Tuberibacillus sp. Marseille-P3662 TaxID=1965358 RepID=UPI000A1CCAC6|nr:signal peptidase II [Tuberibacillus sp. Marseille-P3662]